MVTSSALSAFVCSMVTDVPVADGPGTWDYFREVDGLGNSDGRTRGDLR